MMGAANPVPIQNGAQQYTDKVPELNTPLHNDHKTTKELVKRGEDLEEMEKIVGNLA